MWNYYYTFNTLPILPAEIYFRLVKFNGNRLTSSFHAQQCCEQKKFIPNLDTVPLFRLVRNRILLRNRILP
jgi:hypothetical protein